MGLSTDPLTSSVSALGTGQIVRHARETLFADTNFTLLTTIAGTAGVTVRSEAVFLNDPDENWSIAAQSMYAILRDGSASDALPPQTWGPTLVQQVTLPYLVDVSSNNYVPGSEVFALEFNMLLANHTMSWLTEPKALEFLAPLKAMDEVAVSNMWKHAYYQGGAPTAVAASIQASAHSTTILETVLTQIQDDLTVYWPPSEWGTVELLAGAQIQLLGGQLRTTPAPPRLPPAPLPPVPPTDPVTLVVGSFDIAATSGADVPVIGAEASADSTTIPVAVETVSSTDFPNRADAWFINIGDATYVSVYLDMRLVGFTLEEWLPTMQARARNILYPVTIVPSP